MAYRIKIRSFPHGEGLAQTAFKDEIVDLSDIDIARAVRFGAIDVGTVLPSGTPSAPNRDAVFRREDTGVLEAFAADKWVGVEVGGAPTRSTVLLGTIMNSNPSLKDYNDWQQKIAPRGIDLLMLFNGWSDQLLFNGNKTVADALDAVLITAWQPAPNVQGTDFNGKLGDVTRKVAGVEILNAYLLASANAVKAYNKPVIVRLAHEFNGDWNSYGYEQPTPGESPEEFIAGWKYVVDFFRAQNVSNVLWAWTPNSWDRQVGDPGNIHSTDPVPYYPGDDYVDIIGLDGYQNVKNPTDETPEHIFLDNYHTLTSLTSKPFIIAETGVAEEASVSKATWFNQLFAMVRDKMPRCVAVCYWSRFDVVNGEGDYTIDSSGANASALAAFKKGVNGIPMHLPSKVEVPGWKPQTDRSPAKRVPPYYSRAWAPDGVAGGMPFKVLEENFPYIDIAGSDFTIVTATPHCWMGPTLRAGESYTRLTVLLGTGAEAGGVHTWFAITDMLGNLLGVTNDINAVNLGATVNPSNFTFAAPVERQAETPTRVWVVQEATSLNTFRGKTIGNTVNTTSVSPLKSGKVATAMHVPADFPASGIGAIVAPAVPQFLPWVGIG